MVSLLVSGAASGQGVGGLATTIPGNDWAKYLADNAGSGFTPETLITPPNAAALRPAIGWPIKHGWMATQPVVANGFVYWGSGDGFEYAAPMVGTTGTAWATYLGRTDGTCGGGGVAGTGAVASVTLPGDSSPTSVVFVGGGGNDAVGGGQAQLYALNALTGAVIWRTALGVAPQTFVWSSPAVLMDPSAGTPRASVYVGVSSFSDCPLVQGRVVELDAATGTIEHTFDAVPDGCTGASVWGSPTIDASGEAVYVATGNAGYCTRHEPFAVSLLKLRASDLALIDKWQIPVDEQVSIDPDFGSAPTLFDGTVTRGAGMRPLVGIANKNGVFYVFDRGRIGAGPVARLQVAEGGSDPEDGDGSISPSAFDGRLLYVAGGTTSIDGISCRGSVRAFDPDDLSKPVWERCLNDGPVIAAVTAAPGLVAVGAGSYVNVLSSVDGTVLFRVGSSSAETATPAPFWGAPSISHGTLYEGDAAGAVYAYTALVEVSDASLPSVQVGRTYARTVSALGGTPPYSWRRSGGTLPRGLSLSGAGKITGKATTTGNYSFEVEVTDSGSPRQTATRSFSIGVKRPARRTRK